MQGRACLKRCFVKVKQKKRVDSAVFSEEGDCVSTRERKRNGRKRKTQAFSLRGELICALTSNLLWHQHSGKKGNVDIVQMT